MPSFTERGLVTIQVRIGPDALRRDYCDRNMEPLAEDILVSALIDTGAEACIVDLSLLEKLRIYSYDKRNLKGITGDAELHPVYGVWLKAITKGGDVVIDEPELEVLGVPLQNPDYQVILGMDVLRSVTITLNHSKKYVQICATCDEKAIS
jgi:hypothetical protein